MNTPQLTNKTSIKTSLFQLQYLIVKYKKYLKVKLLLIFKL